MVLLQQRYEVLLRIVFIVFSVFILLQLGVFGANLYSHTSTTADHSENDAVDLRRRAIELDDISSDQARVTQEFCARRNRTHLKYLLPNYWKLKYGLYRHLLVDDDRRLLFAYLPKVASSHIRRFVCVLTGVLPKSSISRQKLTPEEYKTCIQNSTLLRQDLTQDERMERIRSHWKVAILRNPFHRLVSAFRDKIINPVLKPHEREWSLSIMKLYNQTSVDFDTYLRWIVDTPNQELNEHFAPMVELLLPCRVDYNYFGNFRYLSHEISTIADRLRVSKKLFVDEDYYKVAEGNRTSNYLDYYYSRVSQETKAALFRALQDELEFYYNMFPEERDSHVRYLGVSGDIPVYTFSEEL